MGCVEKAAKIVNLPHLIKRKMTDKDAITLYNSVKHLFRIPAGKGKRRRYETLSWKTYYNMLSKPSCTQMRARFTDCKAHTVPGARALRVYRNWRL